MVNGIVILVITTLKNPSRREGFSAFLRGVWKEKAKTRLAVNRVKPWLTKMINSSSSNTMIWIWNLNLGHLIDTLNYLATPTHKSIRFLIIVIIVSAQSKELGFGFFRLGLTLGSEFGACWDRGLGTWTRAWQYSCFECLWSLCVTLRTLILWPLLLQDLSGGK